MGKFINIVKIGGIYNMHHWLRGMDAPVQYRNRGPTG